MNIQKIPELVSMQLKLLEVQREISSFILEIIEEQEIKEEDKEEGALTMVESEEELEPRKRKSRK